MNQEYKIIKIGSVVFSHVLNTEAIILQVILTGKEAKYAVGYNIRGQHAITVVEEAEIEWDTQDEARLWVINKNEN